MELQQIRYFLEVAATQHVTQSAQKLHIAQPALTQSIHRLEKELGVALFLPKGRGIVLTEPGKYLKSRLEPIIRELDSLPDQLQTMAALSRNTIHLNVLAASTLITEAIIEYRTSHQDVSFQLMQNEESELYDISVTTKLFYQTSSSDEERYTCTERIFLAVPNNDHYRSFDRIRLTDVQNEGFISLLGSRQMRWICDKFCHHAGFQPKIIFESDNPAAVRNMIASNMGVGFWPEFSWGKLDSSQVRLLEIEYPLCQRDLLFTLKRNKLNTSVVEDFFHFLLEYCQKASHATTAHIPNFHSAENHLPH